MLLEKWQFKQPFQTISNNNRPISEYYFENNYWNLNWNENEQKFIIPFERHSVPKAQVR